LTNSILPYITCIADQGFDAAIRSSSAIRRGTYTYDGHCVRRQLADELGAPYLDVTAG
jgi:alanine dehydrogenase